MYVIRWGSKCQASSGAMHLLSIYIYTCMLIISMGEGMHISVLAEYVLKFGGGEGVPMVRYLESFAKEYGGTRKLGGTFFQAVTQLQTPNKTSTFPMLRAAFVAANLICPTDQVVDQHARLLTKSDIALSSLCGVCYTGRWAVRVSIEAHALYPPRRIMPPRSLKYIISMLKLVTYEYYPSGTQR